jgi:hypothetical protein
MSAWRPTHPRAPVRRYNVLVPAVNPQPQPEPRLRGQAPPLSRLLALAAAAVPVMARLVLTSAPSRSWHRIRWGAL